MEPAAGEDEIWDEGTEEYLEGPMEEPEEMDPIEVEKVKVLDGYINDQTKIEAKLQELYAGPSAKDVDGWSHEEIDSRMEDLAEVMGLPFDVLMTIPTETRRAYVKSSLIGKAKERIKKMIREMGEARQKALAEMDQEVMLRVYAEEVWDNRRAHDLSEKAAMDQITLDRANPENAREQLKLSRVDRWVDGQSKRLEAADHVRHFNDACEPVSYTHLTLPTKRIV
eukprot:TRINITY_DN43095_c0_g2_i1.p1 TRINITY_DN43095_c0_g2~~TRINITY_DN43095_c0_g2_i1.p1  ORF type:complete len:225 (-),score=77.94 TRINITY_DN43095_c0_g2_i1:48-722(-)